MPEASGAANLDNAGLAFGLVCASGLATAVGALAVFEKRIVKFATKQVLAAAVGFSGGIMLYISMIEIFYKSLQAFADDGKIERDAYVCATLTLFAGMFLVHLLSIIAHRLDRNHHGSVDGVHSEEAREISDAGNATAAAGADAQSAENGASAAVDDADADAARARAAEEGQGELQKDRQLHLMGFKAAVAIALHNFPEGIAAFVAMLADPSVGATVAFAIAVHNMPEGVCVALPIYYATNSRIKAFLWALLAGISELIGALIAWIVLSSAEQTVNKTVFGALFGLVGGMMIMIVISEFLPTGHRYDPEDRYVTNSVVAGMVVMAFSLCLEQY